MPETAEIPWCYGCSAVLWLRFRMTYVVCVSIVVLMRKQWTGARATRVPSSRSHLSLAVRKAARPFWKTTAFWWGAIPAVYRRMFRHRRFIQQGCRVFRIIVHLTSVGFPQSISILVPSSDRVTSSTSMCWRVSGFSTSSERRNRYMNRVGFSLGDPGYLCFGIHAVGCSGLAP